jgi:hypothetical protein
MKNIIFLFIFLISIQSCTEKKGDNSSETSEKYKKQIVDVDLLASKSEPEILKILGSPQKSETVNPSKTPCPCPKNYYSDGVIEIVFINGKADWITVNEPLWLSIEDEKAYLSVSRFDDYAYIKVKTK